MHPFSARVHDKLREEINIQNKSSAIYTEIIVRKKVVCPSVAVTVAGSAVSAQVMVNK